MHKFLRSIGFSKYQNKREIEKLLKKLIDSSSEVKCIQLDHDVNLCEMRAEVAPGMGVSVIGELNEDGDFSEEYYYPYLISDDNTSDAECSIQRHTEKETYAGLLDEYRVGISLIFYVQNSIEYREKILKNKKAPEVDYVKLAGLSVSGKVLLPLQKTAKQIEKAKVASKDRNSLIEAAKNGDEDAMESLTIEDIDLYSQISRRMLKEDIYSIIDTCFMPCGIECDQYSVIGEIRDVKVKRNSISDEEIYDLTLDCNDMLFHVGINKKDLLGEPIPGRRFKGKIWMQGNVTFKEQ